MCPCSLFPNRSLSNCMTSLNFQALSLVHTCSVTFDVR